MLQKRIKWEICRYYERNGYTIRVPAFMKRRFRECLKKQQQLENTLSRKVSIEAALRELGTVRFYYSRDYGSLSPYENN